MSCSTSQEPFQIYSTTESEDQNGNKVTQYSEVSMENAMAASTDVNLKGDSAIYFDGSIKTCYKILLSQQMIKVIMLDMLEFVLQLQLIT